MDIHESVHRILERKDSLGELFYAVFLERHPEVQRYFAGVDLRQQALMLTMALLIVERHYSGAYPATGSYLKYLGSQHHTRKIPAELYPKFCDALLAALGRFHGPDWDGRLAVQWGEALDRAAATMLQGYEQRFTV
jgi:hemoglobin-like flavoprotein